MKKIIRKIHTALAAQRYNIGFVDEEEKSKANPKIHWLKLGSYRKGWFADPFILKVSDKTMEILVEEYLYNTRLGRLSLITVDAKTYRLLKVDVILELPTHLSFPIPIIENNKVYIYPENYQGGALTIYEYDMELHKLVKPTRIIEQPLLDTQIIKIDSTYYAMGVAYSSGSHQDTKTLHIYSAPSLLGPYQSFQTIQNDKCEERGAGEIVKTNGKYLRPTQNCEGDYGLDVIIKELILTKDNKFTQKEIRRISPNHSLKYGLGLHTYNSLGGKTVVDGRGYRHMITRLIKSL